VDGWGVGSQNCEFYEISEYKSHTDVNPLDDCHKFFIVCGQFLLGLIT